MRMCVRRVSDCKNVNSCWEIAREGPVQGVSCGSRELLQWTVKTVDRRG
jgi:hypothetical protein